MEGVTVDVHILLKFHPATCSCKLQVIATLLWFAISQSDVVGLFVCRNTLKWTTADISCLIDIKSKCWDEKDVWWCLSQHIAGILHETHANYHIMMYGSGYYSEWHDGQNADFALFQLIKRTNPDIQDAACLHVVHMLQHPTSRPTTRWTHDTMVNDLKNYFSPLLAGKYGKLTKQSTQRRHQANESKRGLEAERVRALGAVRSLRSRKMLSAENRCETHFLSNEEREKWIEAYVERQTAVARKRVQDAETAIMQELKDMTSAESMGATTRKPETTFEEIMNAIRDSLSNLASSDNGQDGEDKGDDEEDTEVSKLSDDDEPGWVMGTISKTVQHRIERFRQKQMRLDELTELGWGDAANYFCGRDMKHGTAKSKVQWLLSPKYTRLQPQHPRKHLESICTLLISWVENGKCRQWLLDQEVVKWSWVQSNQSYTNTDRIFQLTRRVIWHWFTMRSLLNP